MRASRFSRSRGSYYDHVFAAVECDVCLELLPGASVCFDREHAAVGRHPTSGGDRIQTYVGADIHDVVALAQQSSQDRKFDVVVEADVVVTLKRLAEIESEPDPAAELSDAATRMRRRE